MKQETRLLMCKSSQFDTNTVPQWQLSAATIALSTVGRKAKHIYRKRCHLASFATLADLACVTEHIPLVHPDVNEAQ